MRFSTKKCMIFFFLTIVIILTWNFLSNGYDNNNYTRTCYVSERYHEELHKFTDKVHQILNILNLTHFLCYGSLWGEIRHSKLLPWEDKSVMCLLNEEILAKDELTIVRLFKKSGFYLSYDARKGQYEVTRLNNDGRMKVVLILFEMDKVIHMYRRIGWMRRVLPPNCEGMESLDCFPPRLIMSPLQMKEFGGSLIPVPREGVEMQKYHYKKNWWEEVPLKNC